VDVRILSASHQELASLVQRGEFRQDLYYRLNVIELKLPPLRDRGEDIGLLAAHMLARFAGTNAEPPPRLDPGAMSALFRHPFPGNVRELENILERAATLCNDQTITADDLQLPSASPGVREQGSDHQGADLGRVLESVEKETILKALEQARWNRTAAARHLGISFGALRYRMQKLGLH